MSKIGTKKISIPASVNLTLDVDKITIKGKEGEIILSLPKSLTIVKTDGELEVKRSSDEKKIKSLHGLYRQLISNAVTGVEKPWEKHLEVVGTGFNVKLQGNDLVLKVGFSHPVSYKKPEGIKFLVVGTNKITVLGANKQLVGEVSAQIKMIRKPDVYKGKGVKFAGEKLRIKPGKKAKAAGPTA